MGETGLIPPVRPRVRIRVVYEVVCDLCGIGRIDAEVFDTRLEAEERQSEHISYHEDRIALYGACRREAYRRGLRSLVTYTRDDEPGTSLLAAGWYRVGHRVRTDRWDCKARARELNGGEGIGKTTWEAW